MGTGQSPLTRQKGGDRLLTRGDDLNFNLIGWRGKPGFYRGASGGIARRHPGVPDEVHVGERADVGEVNRRRKEAAFIGAGFGQQVIDRLEYLSSLAGNVA